jgi:hypothetical protein
MKYLKGTSDFHYKKALIKQQKQKGMITENQYFLFAEWLPTRYERDKERKAWVRKWLEEFEEPRSYTTAELWEIYQRTYLGKKG